MADNNNETKTGFADFLKNMLEAKRNHVDSPSEKICKLSIERDMIYDRVKSLEKDIEKSKANGEDCTFLESQHKSLDDYKNLLGDQIKKLIDET